MKDAQFPAFLSSRSLLPFQLIFGCCLVWLMETFLEAMDGIAPRCIITDQDFAMRAAIDRVFPDAIHRNCRWHVMQNATEKMGSYMATRPELHEAFNACVNNSLTPEEFEDNWNAMLDMYGERDNMDLRGVWEHRACWVPAYFMHAFFPCRTQLGAKGSTQYSKDT